MSTNMRTRNDVDTPVEQPETTIGRANDGPTSHRTTIGRRVALFLATATLALGFTAGTGTPAEAAPTTAQATICIQAPFYVGNSIFWGQWVTDPVMLDVWFDGGGHQMLTLHTDSRGCLSTPLIAGYYWRFRVSHAEAGAFWYGTTAWQKATAGGLNNFGTLRLSIL